MKIDKKVNFDVCTYCNHKCTFCSNSDSRTIKDQTSLDEFKKVMTNVVKYVNITELGLSAKGEVLVNNDFVEIVKSAKIDFDVPYLFFSTNGALLDDKRANSLLEAGIDSIKFSINATTRESYKNIHLVDDFDIVIKNFKNLLKLKRQKSNNLKIFLSSVINMDEESLKREFKELTGEDYELIDGISVYPINFTPKFEVSSKKEVTKKCQIPFDEIYINSDGSLGLCCKDYFDEINFGSLKSDSFMKLYDSKEFIDIKNMHKNSKFPDNHLCKNCLLYGEA